MKHWRGGYGLVAKLGRIPLVCVLALGTGALSEGCSSAAEGGNGDVDERGSLGVSLEVAAGVTLSSVTYSITGNGFSKTGSIDVSNAPVVSANIGGIPTGNGYTITLTATSVEGATFSGSARFNVTAGGTTAVTIHLKGAVKTGNGNVAVNGTFNVAPVIDELTVTPLTVFVGSKVSLSGVGSDPDEGPSPVSYYWETTGGVIDEPIRPNATLTSATPGTFTVKLTISDGESTDSVSTTVNFVLPESEGGEGGAGGAGGAGGEGGATGGTSGEGGAAGSGKRPNILFLFIDDLGAESTSLYPELAGDSGQVPLPNIEALAENGLVFDNAWASPLCSPTRGTIVTGQYGYRTSVTNVGNVLPTSTPTLFDRLTADSPSYGQAVIGKYHLGGNITNTQHVTDIGIPYFKGILGGGISNYFDWTVYSTEGAPVQNTTFATTALTDYAIDYIHAHEAEKPDQPWFVYQAYNAPHAVGANSPFQVPPAELHSVDLSSVGNPAPGTITTSVPVYKALVQSLDTEIGRLLKEVDLEETVVIFLGDNGTPGPVKDTGSGLRNSKGSVYEGGVRVPLLVAGAGVTRRGREDELFVSTDVYATILSLAGVPVTQTNNSYSIKPLLTDEAASSGRLRSFTEVSNGTNNRRWAVKDKRYKLIYNLGTWELYDLVADPLEATNLYSSPEHAAVLSTLKAEIATLKAQGPDGYFP